LQKIVGRPPDFFIRNETYGGEGQTNEAGPGEVARRASIFLGSLLDKEPIMKNGDLRFVVAPNLKGDVPGLLSQTDGVVAGIEAHAVLFPNASSVVQGLKDARKALADKHVETGPLKRSARARSPEERALRNKVTDAARFVETTANDDPANGPAIIAASTFSQKARSTHSKGPLNLRRGPASDSVVADAKAVKKGSKAFYSWRYSVDGGATWIEVAQTNIHLTLLEGLPVGKTVFVQVAITQKNIRGPWSDSASLLVH
jgi:hypothetical protein